MVYANKKRKQFYTSCNLFILVNLKLFLANTKKFKNYVELHQFYNDYGWSKQSS